MKTKPTDDEILAAMSQCGSRSMTYVIANRLRTKLGGPDTAFVLRRLKAMEKAGKVKRMPTSYAVQLCWSAATPTSEGDANAT